MFLTMGGDVTDLPSECELYPGDDDPFHNLILSKRDKVLLDLIEQYYHEKQGCSTTIGIIYGAKHMRAVVHLLMGKYGYMIANAEWVTIANLV